MLIACTHSLVLCCNGAARIGAMTLYVPLDLTREHVYVVSIQFDLLVVRQVMCSTRDTIGIRDDSHVTLPSCASREFHLVQPLRKSHEFASSTSSRVVLSTQLGSLTLTRFLISCLDPLP